MATPPSSTLPTAVKPPSGNRQPPPPWRAGLRDIGWVVAGATLAALAFNLLLRPAGIAPGGVPGIALLAQQLWAIKPALTLATLNLTLLALGGASLGRKFFWRSLLGSLLVPILVAGTSHLPGLTSSPLLAALCGGVVMGAGIGLVFLGRGSVGGFSTIALLLHRRAGIPVDRTLTVLDGLVVLAAVLIVPVEQALCAAVAIVLIGQTARRVVAGSSHAIMALIITSRPEALRQIVLHELDLGLTQLGGEGGFTGEPRAVLMVVTRPLDVPRLKRAVAIGDPAAFVTLTAATEVLGYGFAAHE